MSATIDVRNLISNLEKKIKDSFSPREMQRIANFVIEDIKERSRRGYGVERSGGPEERFEPLSYEYIQKRRKMQLSPFTTAGKSNVTRSGRMLASLRYKTAQGSAEISPSGTSREGISNAEIAGYVSERRPFMNLSKLQIHRMVEFIKKEIIDIRL